MKRQRGDDLVIYQVASPELALCFAWFYCMLCSICSESCIQKRSCRLLLCFARAEWSPLIAFSTSRIIELVQAPCASEDYVQNL